MAVADSLVQLSDEKILSYNYKDVPTHWRRLYTDAILLKAIGMLGDRDGRPREDMVELIRQLDMVLIVAGAPGLDRTAMVFDLIEMAQSSLPSDDVASRPSKRSKLDRSSIPSPYTTNPIRRVSSPPTLSEFQQLIKSPFIITGGGNDWPAVDSWGSFDYLRRGSGEGRVVPVELGGNYTSEGWGQRITTWEAFLKSLEEEGEGEKQYLAQHDLFRQFPKLLRDIIVPDYIYSSPSAPMGVPYEPPTNEDGYLTNAWLGPEGTVSPAHTDPYYNCYCE